MKRLSLLRWLLTFLAVLSFPIATLAVVPEIPTVEGPITGPGPMHPGIRPGPEGTNLEDFSYITQEYFVSGKAGPTAASYKVRLLVRRPADPRPSAAWCWGSRRIAAATRSFASSPASGSASGAMSAPT